MLNETRRILRDEKALYASPVALLLRAYDHILSRIDRGRPMPLRGRPVKVRIAGLKDPLVARIGTTDFFTISEVFLDGDYSPLLEHARSPVRIILDLGANVGYSIRFWQERFPDSRIIAVEPDPANFELCQRNVGVAEGPSRVVLTQACVLAARGEVLLDVGGPGASGFAVVRGATKGPLKNNIYILAWDAILVAWIW